MPRAILPLLLIVFLPLSAAAQSSEHRRQIFRVPRPSAYLKNNEQIKELVKPVLAAASAATVRIDCNDHAVALGTVVSADGLIVTKASQLGDKPVCTLSDGRKMFATVLGTDEATDLALLRVAATNLTPIVWAEAAAGGSLEPGSMVAAASPSGEPLSVGAISDVPRPMPGPIRSVRPHGWLGIRVAPAEGGPEVAGVTPGGAADKAGLKSGDRIKSVDGQSQHSSDQLIVTLSHLPPNKKVSLLVSREEHDLQLEATLGRSPGRLPHDNWGGGPFSERRWGFASVIAHDLPIAPTDCGGPLVDLDGRCVGLNIARALRVTTYALPPSVVQATIERLRAGTPTSK